MTAHHLKITREMAVSKITVLLNIPMQLGECPIWSVAESSLYWIDILGKTLHRLHPASGAHSFWSVPSEPGCIAFTEPGLILVAMRSGIALLDTNSGNLETYAEPPYNPSLSRFNDGRCDARGRLWIGTLYDPRDHPAGSLFCLERGTMRDFAKPVTVSNGIAFSCDNRTLYHTDTTAHRITAYNFDLDSGIVGPPRLFHQFAPNRNDSYGGRPDGAAVDSEDAYWCAMYEGGRLLRLAPDGEILEEVQVPFRCPTMMAFGGPELRTLYVTSARNNRSNEELRLYPLSGSVISLEVAVPGRPEYSYRL